jgi:hypothetical protein
VRRQPKEEKNGGRRSRPSQRAEPKPPGVGESHTGAEQHERSAGSARDPQVRSQQFPDKLPRTTASTDQIDPRSSL